MARASHDGKTKPPLTVWIEEKRNAINGYFLQKSRIWNGQIEDGVGSNRIISKYTVGTAARSLVIDT
jgi:hypothetical protein